MSEMTLAQFELSDGTSVLMEVAEPENDSAFERVSLADGPLFLKAKKNLEDSLDQVKPVASAVLSKLTDLDMPADDIEVKFGLKCTADAGAVFTTIGGEVSFEITLKWSKPQP